MKYQNCTRNCKDDGKSLKSDTNLCTAPLTRAGIRERKSAKILGHRAQDATCLFILACHAGGIFVRP